MAYITLNSQKLAENFNYLNNLFAAHDIQWSVVSKMLCGTKLFLTELLKLPIKQVCDSRLTNLKVVKSLNPDLETIYIKPPARRSITGIVRYADISMNTEIKTIQWLSEEAQKQHKVHKVIIMIELGELREGVLGEDFMAFYEQVFKLKNIEVVGLGANLSCLYGVLPNQDKLIQLSLYEQLIEARFNRQIPYVSGGSSVTIPLLLNNLLPKGINHFRVGETLFLGTDVYNDLPLEEMHNDVFRLYGEIIELIEKPMMPHGETATNVDGQTFEVMEELVGKTSCRAIVDIGLLDVDQKHIRPRDHKLTFVGASSDMLVIDLGENAGAYKVGDIVEFTMDYMGALRTINSRYIEKRVV